MIHSGGQQVHLAETEWDRSAVSRLLWEHYAQVTKARGWLGGLNFTELTLERQLMLLTRAVP